MPCKKHRKKQHPKAHKKSTKKALKTKGYDPKRTIKIRRKMINIPAVKRHWDIHTTSVLRLLDRLDDSAFPEFALYPTGTQRSKAPSLLLFKALRNAGLKEEEPRKWVLRTDKFNIFIYI
jgi:hypothetical protein